MEVASLAARVADLESSLRKVRRVALGLGVILCAIVLLSAWRPQAPADLTVGTLRADKVIVGTRQQPGSFLVYGELIASGKSCVFGSLVVLDRLDEQANADNRLVRLLPGRMEVSDGQYKVVAIANAKSGASGVSVWGPTLPQAAAGETKNTEMHSGPRLTVTHGVGVGSQFAVMDPAGRQRAVLGSWVTVDGATGRDINWPESNLVLSDESARVVYQAPR